MSLIYIVAPVENKPATPEVETEIVAEPVDAEVVAELVDAEATSLVPIEAPENAFRIEPPTRREQELSTLNAELEEQVLSLRRQLIKSADELHALQDSVEEEAAARENEAA